MKTEFKTTDFDHYFCIGKDVRGKKFRIQYSNYFYANGINMYNGRMYGVLKSTGKRVLLKTATN